MRPIHATSETDGAIATALTWFALADPKIAFHVGAALFTFALTQSRAPPAYIRFASFGSSANGAMKFADWPASAIPPPTPVHVAPASALRNSCR